MEIKCYLKDDTLKKEEEVQDVKKLKSVIRGLTDISKIPEDLKDIYYVDVYLPVSILKVKYNHKTACFNVKLNFIKKTYAEVLFFKLMHSIIQLTILSSSTVYPFLICLLFVLNNMINYVWFCGTQSSKFPVMTSRKKATMPDDVTQKKNCLLIIGKETFYYCQNRLKITGETDSPIKNYM